MSSDQLPQECFSIKASVESTVKSLLIAAIDIRKNFTSRSQIVRGEGSIERTEYEGFGWIGARMCYDFSKFRSYQLAVKIQVEIAIVVIELEKVAEPASASNPFLLNL